MKKVIFTSQAPAAIGPYSQAIRKGPGLFVSGQLGIDPATGELAAADARGQAAQALANLRAILEAAGATVSDVVKTTVFLADLADFQAVNEVYAQTFKEEPPARSCFAVKGLPKGARVEIEAIAFLI